MRRILLALALVPFSALSASAQLDVPPGGARRRSVPEGEGVEIPRRPRGDLAPRSEPEQAARSGVDIAGPRGSGVGDAAGEPLADPERYDEIGAILDGLRGLEDPDDPEARRAVERLVLLGPAGLSAARAALYGDHAVPVVVGGRVLFLAGTEQDRSRVIERLRGRLPGKAIQPLLDSVLEHDPVLGSPSLLVELLDHPQGLVRAAAQRTLDSHPDPSLPSLLAARLRSERGDTRLRALELLAAYEDPTIRNVLADRLGDPKSKVAWLAAQLLSRSRDERTEEMLLESAFGPPRLSRRGAYALLAIAEHEDRGGRVLLDDSRIPFLRAELRSKDPLVAGAAAVSLAGIGFRSEDSRGMEWLDREVPHELVRHVSADVFHGDFSSLQEPASRRLSLISGRSFGSDGPAWRAWWVEAATGFHAHRAVIDVRPEDRGSLLVVHKAGPSHHGIVHLIGPDVPEEALEGELLPGQRVYLTLEECSELIAALRREGVFGAERLPDSRGKGGWRGRELIVRIAGQGKDFRLPAGDERTDREDDWFDRIAGMIRSLADRNRWQRFSTPGLHATQHELWLEERDWWQGERSELDRALRLKRLVLQHVSGVEAYDRGPGIDELVGIYGDRRAVRASDFQVFLDLLKVEYYFSERVEKLAGLAIAAAREAASAGSEGASFADASLCGDLARVLARFGHDAARVLVRVLEAGGEELVRGAASDELPLMRALAAAALARNPTPESLELVSQLLSDPDENVEAAALLALAESHVESARTEILLRARLGTPRIRAAALRATALLGGEGALEVLVRGMADSNQAIQLAAAEGLAELGDPESTALLVSLFGRGSDSPFYEAARRGLIRIGEAAWPDLLRVAASAASASRREAAILLAQAGVPEAASILMTILTGSPSDGRVAAELAVLTCVDFRDGDDPVQSWWTWWDSVVHGDSLAWMRAAAERLGATGPGAADFEGEGTIGARLFLIELMGRGGPALVERARRELSRMLGRDLGALPPPGALREGYLADLRDLVRPSPSGDGWNPEGSDR